MLLWRATNKIWSPFSELSVELTLTLCLQWFCKIQFPYSTSFELKDLIADCATLGRYEKKNCWMLQQGTEKSIFRGTFWLDFGIMTAMILQNTISRLNFFRIEKFDSGVCYFGELQKKNLLNVAARNREENFQSYLSNWL